MVCTVGVGLVIENNKKKDCMINSTELGICIFFRNDYNLLIGKYNSTTTKFKTTQKFLRKILYSHLWNMFIKVVT